MKKKMTKGSKVRITKEFSFEMSHLLRNHDGPCRNIHGHSYRLFVTLIGSPETDPGSPELGMLIDFGHLKKIVTESIVTEFDHALILSEAAFQGSFLEQYPGKLKVFPFEPTCENLILYFADLLSEKFSGNVSLHSLKLHETATSLAEWYASDNE